MLIPQESQVGIYKNEYVSIFLGDTALEKFTRGLHHSTQNSEPLAYDRIRVNKVVLIFVYYDTYN